MRQRMGLVVGALVLLGSLIAEVFYSHPEHAEYWWQTMPGFFAVFGFIGCLVLILGAKILGSRWLQRHDRYYEGGE